jgi:DNA-directed RNA polymerase subunit E'/Rpb7
MDNFIQITNHDVVKVAPSLLNSDYSNNVLKILKHKYEGVCSKFGYIKRNSIAIKNITKGTIEMSTFHGYVLFNVEFGASVCNPAIGSVIECVVKNVNAFGVLCVAGVTIDNTHNNILNIVIPKNNAQFASSSSILDNVEISDVVFVEILGKKYILNNTTINVFGKLINKGSKQPSDNVRTDENDNKLELDEEEDGEGEEIIEDEEDFDENEDDKSEDNKSVRSDALEELDDDPVDEDLSDINSDNDEDYY